MKLTEAQLKELWTRRTARATPRQAECLTEEQFQRAITGEISQPDRAQAAKHMITCQDCAEEYRILRSLRPLVEAMESTLAASAEIAQAKRSDERSGTRNSTLWERLAVFVSPTRAIAASAVLLLISLALGIWLISLRKGNEREIAQLNRELAERDRALVSTRESLNEARRQLEETIRQTEQQKSSSDSKQVKEEIAQLRQTITELSKPQIDVPIIDLDPSSPTRGNSTGSLSKIETPPTANFFTLILNITGPQQHSNYEVEIFDSNGKQFWRGQRLRNSRERSVNLTLARRMFPAGRYLIKLYGLRNDAREPVADYPVMISYQ
jgi:hypothetical protein